MGRGKGKVGLVYVRGGWGIGVIHILQLCSKKKKKKEIEVCFCSSFHLLCLKVCNPIVG